MKLFHFIFIGLLVSFIANAQEQHCFTTEAYKQLVQQHPELLQTQAQLEQYTKQYTAEQAGKRTAETVYIIPLVFHIIHNYGPENISDAQVLDQVRILNLDFRKLNADTGDVVPAFKSIAADCNIEFRLANIDPDGNCTNGIDRVVSPLTYNAADNAKLNPWIGNKNNNNRYYLNIWVVNSLADVHAAAYAYYPGVSANIDGVIVRHSCVGSIGTSSPFYARTITHEIGHCLNLKHPWGDTNSPGVNCSGDDQVGDTPPTKGWYSCTLAGATCGNAVDNVQNYMEYSYCTKMFTNGQKARMRAALSSTIGNRNNLSSTANAAATGTNYFAPNVCAPRADFITDHSFICSGQVVKYSDLSWNGQPASWSWSFPGGTPSVSTDSLPVVHYDSPGTYDATLIVSNSNGPNAITKNTVVTVSGGAVYGLPYYESFDVTSGLPGYDAFVINPDNGVTWVRTSGAASSGSGSMMINNYSGNASGLTDSYITPSFNLSRVTQPVLTFKVANAQRDSGSADKLKVYVSENCGMTWVPRFSKAGAGLSTAGIVKTNFVPASAQWRTETVNLSLYTGKPNVRIMFENTSDAGNNIYIDEINLTGAVGINEVNLAGLNFELYPNPSQGETTVAFELLKDGVTGVHILDMMGREVDGIAATRLNEGPHHFTFSNSQLARGIYFVELVVDGSHAVRKWIVD